MFVCCLLLLGFSFLYVYVYIRINIYIYRYIDSSLICRGFLEPKVWLLCEDGLLTGLSLSLAFQQDVVDSATLRQAEILDSFRPRGGA